MRNYTKKVLKLFLSNEKRFQCTRIDIDKNGLLKDKHYNKNIQRSILITSTHSYKMALENNIYIVNGDLGENILVNFNPYDLDIGTKLKINDTILEITSHCTLCKSLTKIYNSLPKLLKNDRGVFAKVIKGGTIKQYDDIVL